MKPPGSPLADGCGGGRSDAFFWRLGKTVHKIATANVDSMGGRFEQVDAVLSEQGVEIAGLQETRMDTCERTSRNYEYWFAGSDARGRPHGVGLAVHKRHYGAVMKVEQISERLLYARIKGRQVCLSIVVTYSPQPGLPVAARRSYYAEIAELLGRIPTHDVRVVLADTNAQFGQDLREEVRCVGTHFFHEKSNDNARRWAAICDEHALCVGATYFEHKGSHQATWLGAAGERTQIDHVLVGERHWSMLEDVRAYPALHLGGGCGSHGHRVVIARIRCRLAASKRPPTSGGPVYDRSKLRSSEVASRIEEDLREAWGATAPPDSLAEAYVDFSKTLLRAAEKHAPKGAKAEKARQRWISDETLALVLQKRQLLQRWFACKRRRQS